jgi:hypothetical protein
VNGSTVGFPASLAAAQVSKPLPIMVFGDVGQGVGGAGEGNNFRYASENSDATATMTKIHGKHQVSFGFEWMKRYLNVGQPSSPAGTYEFDGGANERFNRMEYFNPNVTNIANGVSYTGAEIFVNGNNGAAQDWRSLNRGTMAARGQPAPIERPRKAKRK